MATYVKRTDGSGKITWLARVRVRGHVPTSRTFDRKTDAKAWAEELEAQIRRGGIPSTEADRTTLREALIRYGEEVTPRHRGWKREHSRLKAWMQHDLAHRFLSQLRGTDFSNYRDKRRAEGKAENTIRLELALISKLYKIAGSEWGMEGLRNPIKSIAMPAGSNKRERRLWPDEEEKLLAVLDRDAPVVAAMTRLALETGMRQGELLALTWSDVDLLRRVAHLRMTKNSEPRDVPLSSRAVDLFKALPRAIDGAKPIFAITQDRVIRAFRAACTAAKLENLKFHDLRHEAATRICERLPMHEAMRVIGHKTPSMLMRYYHPKAEDLARKLG